MKLRVTMNDTSLYENSMPDKINNFLMRVKTKFDKKALEKDSID